MEEIYQDLSSPASKEFEQLLNSQFSKYKDITEGKIIEGTVTKTNDKFCFLECGLKSEAVLDINELKDMGMLEKAKEGEKISVLLERTEDKNGEVVVSASKAQKIKGWETLIKKYDDKELINCRLISKVKGGAIAEHVETGTLCFMPGSQISSRPEKDISKFFGEVIKVAIIKADRERGNLCVSRRQVLESHKKEDKAKIIEQFKVGEIIKDATVKGYSSFGAFFEVNTPLGTLDVLTHLQEISYSRINHPDEIFNIGEKHDLLIITIDDSKMQIGCSLKQLSPDPFNHISNYKLNKPYKVRVEKIMDFGCFCSLEPGLSTLLHSSELSWSKKNTSAKKMFQIGQEIMCVITEIDKEKRRVAISYRLTMENPYETMEKRYPVGETCTGVINMINEYALYLKIDDLEVDAFLHCNDIGFSNNPEAELKNYKKGDKLKVKVLEIKKDQQKIRVGIRQTLSDPFDWFKNKKINDTITVQVISSDNKGLLVKPEGCKLEFVIKKSQIAINSADARPSRFVGSERIDCSIAEIDIIKRKVSLSIKLLEELKNKEAVSKFSSPLSGRNLPFSQLSDKLEKKQKKE